jgi:hypothetical protein
VPRLLPLLPLLLLAPGFASPATAALSKEQAACVGGMSRALDQVDRQVTRQVGACMKRHARGKPFDRRDPSIVTLDACVAADPKGAIARAAERTEGQFEKLCQAPFPPFGATDAARVNGAGQALGPDLAHALFGADLGAGLSTDPAASRCQQAAWKAATRCQQVRSAAFRSCQQDAAPLAGSRDELREACLGVGADAQPDPRGRLAARCSDPEGGIAKALAKACGGQDLAALLPGCDGASDAAGCVDREVACHACLELSNAGDLRRSCDRFDDGIANGSCGEAAPIVCQSPLDGEMVAAAADAELEFAGQLPDASQVTGLTVDGVPVALDEEGFFSHPVTAGFGVHFVEVAALDDQGGERRRTCSFLAAETYGAEDEPLQDGLSLKLTQTAVDDGSRASVNSLGDVLSLVLNSQGLRNQIHAALSGANPLKPLSCDQSGPFGTCLVSSSITYRSSSIGGPNGSSLTLVTDGLRSQATTSNVRLSIQVRGALVGIPYDTTGTVTFASGSVALVSDLGVGAGGLGAAVRSGSVTVTIGSIATSFSGLDGFVLDLVVSLANGTVRNFVSATLRDFVTANFNSVLDGLLGGIDVPATGFDVSRVDGTGSIPVELEVAPSSLAVSASRALFGLRVRIGAAPGQDVPSLGVALPAGPVLADPAAPNGIAFAGHVGVVNQALHALWRGGLLHAHLDASLAPELPPGVEADLEAQLPPVVASGEADRWGVQLGALRIALVYPGVFDEPVLLSLGAEASATVAVEGDFLVLQDLTLDAVHVSGVDATLDPVRQLIVEGIATSLLQRLLEAAVGAAAPALPVPAFPIADPLVPYGLPAGGALGIMSPTVEGTPTHLELRGAFGLQ